MAASGVGPTGRFVPSPPSDHTEWGQGALLFNVPFLLHNAQIDDGSGKGPVIGVEEAGGVQDLILPARWAWALAVCGNDYQLGLAPVAQPEDVGRPEVFERLCELAVTPGEIPGWATLPPLPDAAKPMILDLTQLAFYRRELIVTLRCAQFARLDEDGCNYLRAHIDRYWGWTLIRWP